MTFWKWSKATAANATADATINWAEGQSPSSVNDSARAMMAAAATYRDDLNGNLVTAGTADAFTVSTNDELERQVRSAAPQAKRIIRLEEKIGVVQDGIAEIKLLIRRTLSEWRP